jgi:mono/diheme cytochrome c family protein
MFLKNLLGSKRFLLATAVPLTIFLILTIGKPTTAQEPVLPLLPPDAADGLAIYNERCVLCHGPLGMGDGEQALAAGLEPRNFTDPAYHLAAEPQVMFDVIANGSLANGMPPFGSASSNPLNEGDIWNLVAAVYSFGVTPSDLEEGETLFADLEGDAAMIPGLEYWFTHSNQSALADLDNGDWGVDVTGLTEAEKLRLVDYGRAQHYTYANPLAAFEPIEAATITGLIVNGSTSAEVTEGEAILRAFNPNFEQTMIMTTTVGVDGRYAFNLENVLPDWIFLVTTEYNDLTFNSNPNRLDRTQPELNMPIIVYDTTADPGVVTIGQIHMILNFTADGIQVSELYVFNNSANAVFVGETGDFADGVVEISLPAGAEGVNFQRSFGSLESFSPASEVIQTETGWADTVPLRPGEGSTNLLVSYQLPYDDGLQLAHPLAYPTEGATAILPDSGVRLSGEGWESQGSQQMASGAFAAYMNNDLAGATSLYLELDGRPTQLADAQGNTMLVRNDSQELIIGLVALGIVGALAVVMVNRWRADTSGMSSDPHTLLQTIANLDDAYAAGQISESKYQQQREQLKQELIAIWPG